MSDALDDSYRHCEQLARQSRSNFYLAFRTLPREMFREMCALYAFMRQTDDLGDDPAAGLNAEQRRRRLEQWRDELIAALNGDYVPSRAMPALADVVHKRDIPVVYLQEMISGVASDLTEQSFETFADLERYCYQVAGVVGLCCLRIWGYRGPEPREPALACGTAFQLTNILRDVSEDVSIGRVYLPREDLRRFGCTVSDLQAGKCSAPVRDLLRFEVERNWDFYDRALPLRHVLSPPGRRIFAAFHDLYGTLLHEIERADYDVFTHRIHLSGWKKTSVTLRCLLGWERRPTRIGLPGEAALCAEREGHNAR